MIGELITITPDERETLAVVGRHLQTGGRAPLPIGGAEMLGGAIRLLLAIAGRESPGVPVLSLEEARREFAMNAPPRIDAVIDWNQVNVYPLPDPVEGGLLLIGYDGGTRIAHVDEGEWCWSDGWVFRHGCGGGRWRWLAHPAGG